MTPRFAYSEIFPDEKRKSAIQFPFNESRLFRVVMASIAHRGMIRVQHRFQSGGYRSPAWFGIKPKRTRPYTPRTNGKVEQFVQTRHAMGGFQSESPQRAKPVGGLNCSAYCGGIAGGGPSSRPITTSADERKQSLLLSFITTTLPPLMGISTGSHQLTP